ncbi:MAG: hypothetical protein N4A31_05855 [Rickettsiales bacterium]|nr:hypothetical protein [Rickettsiales bacterium]
MPERIEFSPEMQFVGGVVTGKAINPALRYANDQLSGNNKDKSFLDYYLCKGFSISGTMESFTSAVGKSYIAHYTIDLVKSHLEPSAADALTAIMSYCKVAFPMTFAAGLAITTAPPAIELGVNLINTMTSLAGLSSSNDDVDL